MVNFWIYRQIFLESQEDLSIALTDEEYRSSLGPDYIFFEILEPEQLSFTYKVWKVRDTAVAVTLYILLQANPAVFAPSWTVSHSGIPLVPTLPASGCGFIQNYQQIAGRLALIQRGECSFVSKVVRAQEAGAVGVIVWDEDHHNDQFFISMADDTTDREVNIPAAFVLGKNGWVLGRQLLLKFFGPTTFHTPQGI